MSATLNIIPIYLIHFKYNGNNQSDIYSVCVCLNFHTKIRVLCFIFIVMCLEKKSILSDPMRCLKA
jgi:hypothetical protein